MAVIGSTGKCHGIVKFGIGKVCRDEPLYIRKADEYLQAGDRMQASEKGWGAVAEAVKSIAEERGWRHKGHRLLNDIAFQLSAEWERPDVHLMYGAVERLHTNFYEDIMGLDDIAANVGHAKTLLAELATLRQRPPPAARHHQPRAAQPLAAAYRGVAADRGGCGGGGMMFPFGQGN